MNNSESVVIESLTGLALAHPDLIRVNRKPLYVAAAHSPLAGKVGVLSGGGSGHDPLHAGFVGRGMLDAAVPGPVFTSPNPTQVLAAARAIDSGAGVLFIVKNYTGDVMNFAAAAEMAEDEGLEVRTVVVADDVSIERDDQTAGRRGVGGTVFVEKLAGAAAARGQSLDEVTRIAQQVADSVRSMGVGLSAGSLFHSSAPTFDIGDNEIEIGIGIHGEPGRRRCELLPSHEIVDVLLTSIMDEVVTEGAGLILMVNGMGATSVTELHIAFKDCVEWCEARGHHVEKSLIGNYVTSVDMAGFSITVLAGTPELVDLWSDDVNTPAWRCSDGDM